MAAPSSQVNKKLSLKNGLVIVLLLLFGLIVLRAPHFHNHEKTKARSATLVENYRAQMLMRMADAIKYVAQPAFSIEGSSVDKMNDKRGALVGQAESIIDRALAQQSDDVVFLSEKIILKSYSHADVKSELDKLVSISAKGSDLSPLAQKLAIAIHCLYGTMTDRQSSYFPGDTLQTIVRGLPDGWFREQALLTFYKLTNQNNEQKNLLLEIQNKTWHYVTKIFLAGIFGILAIIIGVIVIMYQVLIHERQATVSKAGQEPSEVLPLSKAYFPKSDWQTVAFIFFAWFFTQIIVAFAINWFKQHGTAVDFTQTSPLLSAISIAVIYLLSNAPALLYIYWLALRPNELGFVQGLRLCRKTINSGTMALVIAGILGWFAAIPLVMIAYFISATVFNSGGSSNPIIGIVMEAAQTNDILTVLLFYITLGVLAPICEESLFRGFFYKYLRGRHGVIIANVLSSALFALAHMDPGAVLPLFCLGSIFAYVFERTDSILPCMITHGLWNSATFTLILLLFGGS